MAGDAATRIGAWWAWSHLIQLALAVVLAVASGRRRPALTGLGLALLVVQSWLTRRLAATADAARHEARAQATLAAHDGLTGLLNRRALDARLAALDDQAFAAIFVDLDHFKAINTAYRDHAVGDAALRAVAAAIRAVVRPGAICARYGGEELCVLLPGVERADHAGTIAERIRVAIGQARLEEAPDLSVTASIGVAARRAGEPATATLRRANAGLFAAKDAGCDRVVIVADAPDDSAPTARPGTSPTA
jgi:diguanylate cyclase (GGDEF)-like protein